MAADEAHEAADAEIEAFRREVAGVYREAEITASKTLTEYLERFREQDEGWRDRVARGEATEAQWKAWRRGKILTGRRYRVVLKQVAEGYTHANEVAMDALEGRLPGVYAENYNYGTFQAYSAARVDDAFALQDASTVQRLLTDHDSYLPKPTVNVPKDTAWNRRLLANQITQGVLLGESMPKIAKRVGKVTGANMATAMRTARTSVTAAENVGRVDSYRRAQSLGIELEQEWLATLDGRTRHTHRQLDGEKVKVGGKFENGCRYPGDPEAPYAETCNCRCTLIAAVEGVDYSDGKRWSRLPEGMTYEEWKAGKPAVTGAKPADRTISEFMGMSGTKRKLDAAGVSRTDARRRLTEQLKEYGIPSGSFRKMSAGDQQKVLDTALTRRKPTETELRRANCRPVNEALYNSQKNYVERHGGLVIRGDDSWEAHLDKEKVDAAAIGDTIILRSDATTSEVLEEVFHFRQQLRGDYSDKPARVMRLLRERDAQNYLLGVAERYNIPEQETEQTRSALADYMRDLKEAGYDED